VGGGGGGGGGGGVGGFLVSARIGRRTHLPSLIADGVVRERGRKVF